MEEFSHDGCEGLHFGLAAGQQAEVESSQMRLMANGDEGGHVESAAQVPIAGLADARFLMHGGAGGMLARVVAVSFSSKVTQLAGITQLSNRQKTRNWSMPLGLDEGFISAPRRAIFSSAR